MSWRPYEDDNTRIDSNTASQYLQMKFDISKKAEKAAHPNLGGSELYRTVVNDLIRTFCSTWKTAHDSDPAQYPDLMYLLEEILSQGKRRKSTGRSSNKTSTGGFIGWLTSKSKGKNTQVTSASPSSRRRATEGTSDTSTSQPSYHPCDDLGAQNIPASRPRHRRHKDLEEIPLTEFNASSPSQLRSDRQPEAGPQPIDDLHLETIAPPAAYTRREDDPNWKGKGPATADDVKRWAEEERTGASSSFRV
nr:uncharacterized protein CI109_005577 [Kwoniella shandongensis]KAA5526142.1 hypothetical protein CI109_005577 [Kwoniella shandongensis]